MWGVGVLQRNHAVVVDANRNVPPVDVAHLAGSLAPLHRNRDFQVLWSGQLVSCLGSRARAVATPLLVLALTGSPALAGLASFATTLPLVLLMLPAGVVLDRVDRKRAMIVCETARGLAVASIAVCIWAGHLTYPHLLLFAIVNGIAYPFFAVGERSAIRQLVPCPQLSAAMAQKQARDYLGLIAGQAAGGVLFGVSRLLPYAADAVTYGVSLLSLALVRSRFQLERVAARRSPVREALEGLAWLWSRPFLRTTALLGTGLSAVANALSLAVIVAAQRHGAPPALVGFVVALMGVGGLLGATVATPLVQALSVRAIAVATGGSLMVLTVAMAFAPSPALIGVLFGATYFLQPAWGAASSAWQVRLVPDHLLSRVQGAVIVLDAGAVPLAQLGVGLLLQVASPTATILMLSGVAAAVTIGALACRSLRAVPRADPG